MDISAKQDCNSNIERITLLINSGIFEPKNNHNPLQKSAFIDLMICLRDLLFKTEKYVARISFTDDILTNEYVKDVTDAITAVRDACCHIDSFKKLFNDQGGRGEYNVSFYWKGTLMKIGKVELTSDYNDDIAFFYGRNRLYLNRHIIRAFNEAKEALAPLLSR
jgi:hypothetical protein